MIVEYRPFLTRSLSWDPSSESARRKAATRTWRLGTILDQVSLDRGRSLRLQILLGVIALAWIALVGALLLRPSAAPPEAAGALPPLGVSLPPSAEVESNSYGQVPVGRVESGKPEPEPEPVPVPVNPGVPHEASAEPTRPAASTRVRVQDETPPTHALEAPRRYEDESDRAAPPPHLAASSPHLHEPAPRAAPLHGVHAVTITTGHRYSATVTLSFVEAFADNSRIASVLISAGFADVAVTGSGNTRTATGTWTGATMTRAVDPHLSNVRDLSG
jgi:hypothetical protein